MPTLAHVPSSYTHYQQAVPRGTVTAAGALLKYYHLERAGEPVPDAVDALARAALADDPAFRFSDDYGFCILHRCGARFYFLLPTVWRGANEAWEAVWYLDGGATAFAPFDLAYPPSAGPTRPAFCVWELAIVAHEAASWSGFLSSSRDEGDLTAWLDDRFSGEV